MPVYSCTLLADGSSDRVLEPLLRALLELHCPHPFELQFAQGLSAAKHPLPGQLQKAVDDYPCDLLFVHRDAEKDDPELRSQQIRSARQQAGIGQRVVTVVPVRMTEAWLLVDEAAIRAAARNPNGVVPLGLPKPAKLEALANPKETLFSALRNASELTGRKLRQFQPEAQRHRIAEHMASVAPLRALTSFERLETQLTAVFQP